MFLENLRYCKGTKKRQESIQFDVVREWKAPTVSCIVDVDRLLMGVNKYRCCNGESLTLNKKQKLELLKFLKINREKTIGLHQIKTYDGWCASGLRELADYCFPNDFVDERIVDYLVENTPAISLHRDCTQVGEAFDIIKETKTGRWRNIYATFTHLHDGIWKFRGYCFPGQVENMSMFNTTLDRKLSELGGKV